MAGSRLRPAEWVVCPGQRGPGHRRRRRSADPQRPDRAGPGVVLGWLALASGGLPAGRRRAGGSPKRSPTPCSSSPAACGPGSRCPGARCRASRTDPADVGELGRALAAARIGVPLEDALDRIATRTRSVDWRWTVMAIRIQRDGRRQPGRGAQQHGADHAGTAQPRRHVRALSAEGRLSAYILIGCRSWCSGPRADPPRVPAAALDTTTRHAHAGRRGGPDARRVRCGCARSSRWRCEMTDDQLLSSVGAPCRGGARPACHRAASGPGRRPPAWPSPWPSIEQMHPGDARPRPRAPRPIGCSARASAAGGARPAAVAGRDAGPTAAQARPGRQPAAAGRSTASSRSRRLGLIVGAGAGVLMLSAGQPPARAIWLAARRLSPASSCPTCCCTTPASSAADVAARTAGRAGHADRLRRGRSRLRRRAGPGGPQHRGSDGRRVRPAPAGDADRQDPRRGASRTWQQRTTVPELRTFVSALVQSDELGIPIASVLRGAGERDAAQARVSGPRRRRRRCR